MKLLMRLFFPMLLLFGTALGAWADATGVFIVDGEGNFSGHNTLSLNGTILSETFTGTVTVNPDCTTSATVVGSVAGEAHFDGVLVAGSREILLIRRDPGTVLFGSAKKQ